MTAIYKEYGPYFETEAQYERWLKAEIARAARASTKTIKSQTDLLERASGLKLRIARVKK